MSEGDSDPQSGRPRPTAPDSIPVSARGFADESEARHVAEVVAATVRAISRYIDLERLDGITVAYDYDEALAQLDRGYTPTLPLTRSKDELKHGVAMAPAVIREGVVKGHLMFFAPYVLPLAGEENAEFEQALYVVAHECAHVEDLKHRDLAFPHTILQRCIAGTEEAFYGPLVQGVWEEYAACRASAIFRPEHVPVYEECLVANLRSVPARANEAIRAYRRHGDIDRLVAEAARPLCEPLLLSAYLAGHLDGLDGDVALCPEAQAALVESDFTGAFEELRATLRDLWSRRGTWTSEEEFHSLWPMADRMLAQGGIIVSRLPSGDMHLEVPFTAETMASW